MKKLLVVAAVILLSYLIAFAAAKLTAKPKKIKPFVEKLPAFTIGGHRGAPHFHPENTVESFRKTLEIDKNALLEMDVWLTSDNVVVVKHDGDVDRTTEGHGPVKSFTFAELRKLDAGYNITFDEEKTFPFRGRGYRIPSLEEVLKEFKGHLISIDIKHHTVECTDLVMKLVSDSGMIDNVIIGTFGNNVLDLVREKYPQVSTSFSKGQAVKFLILHKIGLSGLYRAKDDALMVPEYIGAGVDEFPGEGKSAGLRIVSLRFISDAAALNIPVMVWTVNNADNMKRLKGYGVRGIITDHPDILYSIK
jgi:glycerophosphoryl diester phosphodiesterase